MSLSALEYSFPQPNIVGFKYSGKIEREALLAKTLHISHVPEPTPATVARVPIAKMFSSCNHKPADPLNDIIEVSKKIVRNYKLELASQVPVALFAGHAVATPVKAMKKPASTINITSNANINSNVHTNIHAGPKQPTDTLSRGQKRARSAHMAASDEVWLTNPAVVTPLSNKPIIFFSPSGSAKKASVQTSTPSGGRILRKPSLQRLLRSDLASSVGDFKSMSSSPQQSTPVKPFRESAIQEADDDSEYDQLACHAGNIMRMAVDSTLLGSSYNASILSNYLNTSGVLDANDSLNGVLSRKKANFDFVFDEHDPEKSLLEMKKSRWNSLSKERATKIEINAEDISKILGEI